MNAKRFSRAASLAAATLSFTGCTIASDLDRFESAELCTPSIELTEFHFHSRTSSLAGHPMILRLVKRPEGVGGIPSLRALAILDRTPAPDIDLVLPNAVRADEGPFDVDFYADVDETGTFTPSVGGGGSDHSWILEDVCSREVTRFPHSSDFEGFDEPQTNTDSLTIDFTNMPTSGGALEVQLLRLAPEGEDTAARTVGLYRLDSVEAATFTIALPGIVDPDPTVGYEIRIWADADENDEYDLGKDDSWVVETTGDALALGPLAFDFALRDSNREDIERILVALPL